MIFSYNSATSYVLGVADNLGVRVQFDEKCTQPYTTAGGQIVVPPYNPTWSWGGQEHVLWTFFVLHEVFHHTREPFFKLLADAKVNMQSPLGFVLNLKEDFNIEWKNHGKWKSRDALVEQGRLQWNSKSHSTIIKQVDDPSLLMDDLGQKMNAVWILDGLIRSKSLHPTLRGLDYSHVLKKQPTTEWAYKKLTSEEKVMSGWAKELDPQETLDFARYIMDLLEIEEPESEEGEGKGKGQGETGEGEGDGEGDEPHGEGKESESGGVGPAVMDYMDLLFHEHSKDGTAAGEMSIIDYSNWKEFLGYTPDGRPEVRLPQRTSNAGRILAIANNNNLVDVVRRLLLVRSRQTWQHSKMSGKVSRKNVSKVFTHQGTVAGLRVFRKKKENNTLDVSVTLLVDESGSMHGQKFIHAAAAAVCLNRAIRSIGVPVEILGFTDGRINDNLCMTHHQVFGEKVNDEAIASGFQTLMDNGMLWNNPDGEAIIYAAERLNRQRSRKKLLVVLSDGMPAGGNCDGDIYGYTKEAVKKIEKSPEIDIIGIGLMSESVKRIYSKAVVIKTADELEQALLGIIKKQILGDR